MRGGRRASASDEDVDKKVYVQGREKFWKKLREDNGIRTYILRDTDPNAKTNETHESYTLDPKYSLENND